MNRKMAAVIAAAVGLVLVMMVSGCSTLKSDKAGSEPATTTAVKKDAPVYYDFGDVLLPHDLKVDKKKSSILSSPGLTAGILTLTGRVEVNSLIGFFENKMPDDGWQMVSALKSAQTMMLFKKQTRWCVIGISESSFSTTVKIFVAPTIGEAETGLLK